MKQSFFVFVRNDCTIDQKFRSRHLRTLVYRLLFVSMLKHERSPTIKTGLTGSGKRLPEAAVTLMCWLLIGQLRWLMWRSLQQKQNIILSGSSSGSSSTSSSNSNNNNSSSSIIIISSSSSSSSSSSISGVWLSYCIAVSGARDGSVQILCFGAKVAWGLFWKYKISLKKLELRAV